MNKILKWNFIFQYGYVLTNIINSIILLPLYLVHINANTLGVWLAATSILNWITLVDPGIGEVLQQKIAELRGRKEDTDVVKLIGSGYIASSIILFLSIVVGLICYFSIGIIIDKDVTQFSNLTSALIISVIATGLSLTSFSMSGINQGLHNSANVAICALSANFLFLLFNLVFLFLGYAVLCIAIANLTRAVFINVYNISSMITLLNKMKLKIIYNLNHFKKFIRIFSFTSSAKIISGLAHSIDMIVLARYISPAWITLYEINKRPFNITSALIGRHSVALMPLISHAKGNNDKNFIVNLINTQFRFYLYAALFAVLLFYFNYENLITLWIGKGQYAGNLIMYLLAINFFLGLACTFMSNVGYALGDIKMNSLFNIVRSILFGVLVFFAAKNYGVVGTLVTSIFVILLADFIFYNYRVYKLGYFKFSLVKSLLPSWSIILPVSFFGGWGLKILLERLMPDSMNFINLITHSALFTIFFMILVLVVDSTMNKSFKKVIGKISISPFYQKIRRQFV